jgi:hypothetical protein
MKKDTIATCQAVLASSGAGHGGFTFVAQIGAADAAAGGPEPKPRCVGWPGRDRSTRAVLPHPTAA